MFQAHVMQSKVQGLLGSHLPRNDEALYTAMTHLFCRSTMSQELNFSVATAFQAIVNMSNCINFALKTQNTTVVAAAPDEIFHDSSL